jgi:thymidylate synthase (FAD)
MKLIVPQWEILHTIPGVKILKQIEQIARTSTRSGEEITEDSYTKLIPHLLSKGHYTPFEFYTITVRFTSSRGVLDEIRTHRIGSYVMESTRYCNYSKKRYDKEISFCIPEWVDMDSTVWLSSMEQAEKNYFALLDAGWKAEQARGVLPLDIASTMTTCYNLRQWREFFKLRTAKATHSELRRLSIPLLEVFKMEIPYVFDDINNN